MARHRDYAPALQGVDLTAVLDVARPSSRSSRAAGAARQFAERFPDADPGPCLRLPQPAGPRPGAAPRCLGSLLPGDDDDSRVLARPPLVEASSIDAVVPRYLAAFGPATAADMAAVAADRVP